MVKNINSDPLWNQVCKDLEGEKKEWVEEMRKKGVKGAHDNDGWIDRDKNIITMVFPIFDDGIEVGDKFAIGFYPKSTYRKDISPRIVEITSADHKNEKYGFKDI